MQKIEIKRSDKLPPHDLQAETSLLGALMLDNVYISNVCTIVSKDEFYDPRHGIVFETIASLYDRSIPVDLLTVADQLQTNSNLEKIGGRVRLTELTEDVYSAANCERYAEIVKEKAILRKLMNTSSTLFTKAQNMEGDVKELLDLAESRIFEIAMTRSDKGFDSIGSLMKQVMTNIETLSQQKGGVSGLGTGFDQLDSKTSGLHNGEFVVIAGRPGMGKTAFALRIIENIALKHNKPCAIFSLEMSSEQIVQRMLCSKALASSHRLRTGRLRDNEYVNLSVAAGELAEAPIFVDDSATLTIWELRTKARILKKQHDIALLVVDYLQLMSGSDRSENRQQEISFISRSLKSLAKELEIPVVACSQLSRMVEMRGGEKRPQLADLRESGAIEQDADVVMFVYRPAAYKFTAEERAEIKGTEEEYLAEINVAKQRNGPTGVIKLTFLDEFIRFENRETHHAEPPSGDPF